MSGRLAMLSPFVLALAAASACVTTTIEPPPRPSGVPAEAIWVGGADGGVFVVVTASGAGPEGTYVVKAYADATGETVFDGHMRLDPPGGDAPYMKDPKTFTGWDGDHMHLRDGRSLISTAADSPASG